MNVGNLKRRLNPREFRPMVVSDAIIFVKHRIVRMLPVAFKVSATFEAKASGA